MTSEFELRSIINSGILLAAMGLIGISGIAVYVGLGRLMGIEIQNYGLRKMARYFRKGDNR